MKGEQDPKLLPDSEYPAWLFKLLDPAPAAGELQKKYEGTGLTMGQVGWLSLMMEDGRLLPSSCECHTPHGECTHSRCMGACSMQHDVRNSLCMHANHGHGQPIGLSYARRSWFSIIAA